MAYCDHFFSPEMRMVDATIPASIIAHAILSTAEATIGRILQFTAYIDLRAKLPTVGYIVELDGELGMYNINGTDIRLCVNHRGNLLGPNSALARHQVLEVLKSQHPNIQRNIDMNKMCLPTISIVEHGTFADCRHWKVKTTGISLTQVKIPVVLFDAELLEWLLKRTVHEVVA